MLLRGIFLFRESVISLTTGGRKDDGMFPQWKAFHCKAGRFTPKAKKQRVILENQVRQYTSTHREGLVAEISGMRRWLGGDALRLWPHRSRIAIQDARLCVRPPLGCRFEISELTFR